MTSADVVGQDRGKAVEPEEEFPGGLAGLWARAWLNMRTGNLGPAPIIVGLAVTVAIFGFTATNFFTSTNFANLVTEMAGTAMLAYGVVFVLLLGEIDLSIGYVAGIGALIVAELTLPGSSWQMNGIPAMIIAIIVCAIIGGVQGSIVAFVGVPSFVVTLAGFLIWQGVILNKLEQRGTIIIQDRWINYTDSYFFSHWLGWVTAAIITALYPLSVLYKRITARGTHIAQVNPYVFAIRAVGLAVVAFGVVAISNNAQVITTKLGLPLAGVIVVVFLILLTFLARWTTFGRHVYAVGGNAEAARRAGHQRPAHPRARLHDLRGDGCDGRHHLRVAGELGRAHVPAREPAAERDRSGGHRRRQPLRRPRRGARRAPRRRPDRDAPERPEHAERVERLDLHDHGLRPSRRRDARHVRRPPAGALRPLTPEPGERELPRLLAERATRGDAGRHVDPVRERCGARPLRLGAERTSGERGEDLGRCVRERAVLGHPAR